MKFSRVYSGKVKYRKLTIACCYRLNSLVPCYSLPEYCFLFLIDQLTERVQVPGMNVVMSEKLWVTRDQFGQGKHGHWKLYFQFYIWTDS